MKSTDKEIEEFKDQLRRESLQVIADNCCKKCNGVRVRSWITSMMAASHGKRCSCKK